MLCAKTCAMFGEIMMIHKLAFFCGVQMLEHKHQGVMKTTWFLFRFLLRTFPTTNKPSLLPVWSMWPLFWPPPAGRTSCKMTWRQNWLSRWTAIAIAPLTSAIMSGLPREKRGVKSTMHRVVPVRSSRIANRSPRVWRCWSWGPSKNPPRP